MSLACDIVKDIMPIYVDGNTSKVSSKLVKRHTKKCAHCAEYMRLCRNSREMEKIREQRNKGKRDDIVCLADDGFDIIAERVNKSVMTERIVSASAAAAAIATALVMILLKNNKK